MKVLVLSCNTGGGHNSSGYAIKEYFENQGVFCEVLDALAFCGRALSYLISRGHVFVYRRLPKLFSLGYRYSENHSPRLMYSEFSKCAGELCKYVLHRGYDTIVCVHVFASFMVTAARQECGLLARAYFVATDYTCSPGVGDLDMDTFFIPHADLTEEFVSKGVPRERIVASGIPIHKNFLLPCDKASARRALSLPETKRVLLLSSGSMGCGPIERVASRLASSLRQSEMLIVICGTNRPLYNSLKRQISSKNVRIIGYCTRMSEYMSAADVYMTKAGGLSTTEAIMRRLPLLCIDAVGGCETRNLEFMKRLGVAEHGKSVAGLCDLALEYARDERLCFMLADNMEKSFSFNGTENLCRYVMNYS